MLLAVHMQEHYKQKGVQNLNHDAYVHKKSTRKTANCHCLGYAYLVHKILEIKRRKKSCNDWDTT